MDVLVIGGGIFLGRHITDHLARNGYNVWHFNRSRGYGGDVRVSYVGGDRDQGFPSILNRHWEAIIDTCGYFPRQLKLSTKTFRDCASLYVYISSVNQYADFRLPKVSEEYASAPIDDFVSNDIDSPLTHETYGPLKAACEHVVRTAYERRALILRPGCMVGPYDQAGRFFYWVRRISMGGDVLVPGSEHLSWQVVDVQDVASWVVDCVATSRSGTYNVVGQEISFGEMFEAISKVGKTEARPVWVSPQWLIDRNSEAGEFLNYAEWSNLPATWKYLYAVDGSRAVRDGLTHRSFEETARSVLTHLDSVGFEVPRKTLSNEREIMSLWSQESKRIDPM